MRKLSIICDGPRDHLAAPVLVKRLLRRDGGESDEPRFEHRISEWPRLNDPNTRIEGGRGHGYEAKLLFALERARDAELDGVVAILDTDRDRNRERLKQAKTARDRFLSKHARMPAAIGEAKPHFDAWLLDDSAAVRGVCGEDAAVPDVIRCASPKNEIDRLWDEYRRRSDRVEPDEPERVSEFLGRIAAGLELKRCTHRDRTGLAGFARELSTEIGPLFAA